MKYRLKYMRDSELYTQKQLSEILGCGARAYGHYEAEEHDIPTNILIKLADLYNVSTDYLLGITNSPTSFCNNKGAIMKYRLKQLREENNLSQTEVARALFVAQRTYSYYENEEHDIPTATLILLADFYNVSVDYILGRTDNPLMNK